MITSLNLVMIIKLAGSKPLTKIKKLPGCVFCLCTALMLVPTGAYSDEATPSSVLKTDPMSGAYIMQLIMGLIVVVLCIVALAWLSKRINRLQSAGIDSFKVIGGINMGARERVVLLQVGEEQLLIGVSPGRINKLHTLATPVQTDASGSDLEATGFSKKLKVIMRDANKA